MPSPTIQDQIHVADDTVLVRWGACDVALNAVRISSIEENPAYSACVSISTIRARLLTAYYNRFVGPASAEYLGWIRIVACTILCVSAAWEDLASTALIPRELVVPMGVLQWLYWLPIGFAEFTHNPLYLQLYKYVTVALLMLAAIGYRCNLTVPLAAVAYVIYGGVLRQYCHLFHNCLIATYLLAALALTPCGAGLSVDQMLRNKRGVCAPGDTAVYGWCRYLCWVAIAIPYFATGLSKLYHGGAWWWQAANLKRKLLHDTLNPMHFDWNFSLSLIRAPDALFALFGICTIALELGFIMVLFSRWARIALPVLIVGMHTGIWLLQNLLFFDVFFLPLVFYDVPSYVRHIHRQRRAAREAAVDPSCQIDDAKVVGRPEQDVPRGRPRSWGVPGWYVPTAVVALVVLQGICTLGNYEYFPFTAWKMYASYNVSTEVSYFRLIAVTKNGESFPFRPDGVIPALRDTRYRDVFYGRHGWGQDEQRRFLETCGNLYNQQAKGGHRISTLIVERRMWDFQSEPDDSDYGKERARVTVILR